MTLLTLTPNPSLDRILTLDALVPGAVHRAASRTLSPGGKGINVARAARSLGEAAWAAGILGGRTGRTLADLCEREGLPARWTWIDEIETRMTSILLHPLADNPRTMTVINERGDPLSAAAWTQFTADVHDALGSARAVCMSGSSPPGVTGDHIAALLEGLIQSGVPLWVDTSGAGLHAALKIAGVNLKVNGDEIGAAFDVAVTGVESALTAARQAHAHTGGTVVVTLGAAGAVMVSGAGALHAVPPSVQTLNPIGSGDSALAALALAFSTPGVPPQDALCRAVAAGTANAITERGGGYFTQAQYQAVLADTRISVLT
ncbi:MAG: hexose kinase [bacterium]|nr:hexose kinase [bacterium]